MIWYDDGTHIYTTPELAPGHHNLRVKVFDKAGNFKEQNVPFEIKKSTANPTQEFFFGSDFLKSFIRSLRNLDPTAILVPLGGVGFILARRRVYRAVKVLGKLRRPGKANARHIDDDIKRTVTILEQTKAKRPLTPLETKTLNILKKDLQAVQTNSGYVKSIEGIFDGQNMVGADGQKYEVPANYASKSKLVQGDILRLRITPEGEFVYKQIAPIEREVIKGVVEKHDKNHYKVISGNKVYNVLLNSIYFYKVKPGDEVMIIVPKDTESQWAAIEKVLKRQSLSQIESKSSSPKKKVAGKTTRVRKKK